MSLSALFLSSPISVCENACAYFLPCAQPTRKPTAAQKFIRFILVSIVLTLQIFPSRALASPSSSLRVSTATRATQLARPSDLYCTSPDSQSFSFLNPPACCYHSTCIPLLFPRFPLSPPNPIHRVCTASHIGQRCVRAVHSPPGRGQRVAPCRAARETRYLDPKSKPLNPSSPRKDRGRGCLSYFPRRRASLYDDVFFLLIDALPRKRA